GPSPFDEAAPAVASAEPRPATAAVPAPPGRSAAVGTARGEPPATDDPAPPPPDPAPTADRAPGTTIGPGATTGPGATSGRGAPRAPVAPLAIEPEAPRPVRSAPARRAVASRTPPRPAPEPVNLEELYRAGVQALVLGDSATALQKFRRVLDANPRHAAAL